MKLIEVEIFTPRLKISPINQKYASIIFSSFTKDIVKYMYPRSPDKIEETIEFIKTSLAGIENGSNLQMVILNKDNDNFIGCLGLHDINTRTPEIGIWIRKEYHGYNYGKEAVRYLVFWVAANLEFSYLRYPVDRRNVPSRRIPESLGGIIEKEFKSISQSGFELDEVEYRIYLDAVGYIT